MISLLWLHVQLLAVRRRIAVEQRGALSTEAVVITAALAALAIVVVAIITEKVTAKANGMNLGG
ncbi:MAG TPA: hypothetical protein VK923_21030 [Euzebyales bacterium]|nr:hypothetical protein [Euzebyales bacterium]